MKRVFNLLVVDESGSMSIIRRQALVGINETLATIQKMQKAHADISSSRKMRQVPRRCLQERIGRESVIISSVLWIA